MECWRRRCDKELETWALPLAAREMDELQAQAQEEAPASYNVPKAGQQVLVAGLRRRANLNGHRAEIVGNEVDGSGRVLVRIYDSHVPGQGGSRKMMMKAAHLLPARNASAPALPAPSSRASNCSSSVRSCSRAGSVAASSANGRAPSVLSSTARSALSNTGSFGTLATLAAQPPMAPGEPGRGPRAFAQPRRRARARAGGNG
eukprot:CAMPEP_0197905954 /NCGR_PEP_ID=MMETSP1439-20131203/61540_1 /TAXON_ID=66791 /ORGANISM="Gonyaulax spinifera, Strain CCMP409" /LENGTH=202 /DNA_ID=CAMNT_0043527271 /DNA_START=38 /DNA_END=643 /DNA_ORIENTATION=-